MADITRTKRENEILTDIIEIVKRYLDPERIILFGSRAKQNYRKSADFDIAIEKEPVDIRTERKIKEEIEQVAGLYKVDLIFLKNVDSRFREMIIKTGQVVYERKN